MRLKAEDTQVVIEGVSKFRENVKLVLQEPVPSKQSNPARRKRMNYEDRTLMKSCLSSRDSRTCK